MWRQNRNDFTLNMKTAVALRYASLRFVTLGDALLHYVGVVNNTVLVCPAHLVLDAL